MSFLTAAAVWRDRSEVCAGAIYREPGYYGLGFGRMRHGQHSFLNIESMIC
jgi:hypothetical protein